VAAGLCQGSTLPTDAQVAAIIAAIRPPHIGRPATLAERLTAQRAGSGRGLPLTPEPFDRPTWARCTVHPDHHIQFRRALYSVPTRYIGQALEVRGDSRLVHLYHHGDLIKVHASQPAGGRATDYVDYPAERTPYALRAPDRCIDQAQRLGPAVGQFITVLLRDTFPCARLRQAQKLLRLAERYGPDRINAACARALAFDLLNVGRVEAIVRTALARAPADGAGARVVPLPGRFTPGAREFHPPVHPPGGS
jgi:hypothetical protein